MGDRLLGFVGELEIDALWKLGAGDCEFCRRKGDCRTLPVSEAAGERVEARKDDCQKGGVSDSRGRSDVETYHLCCYDLVTVAIAAMSRPVVRYMMSWTIVSAGGVFVNSRASGATQRLRSDPAAAQIAD